MASIIEMPKLSDTMTTGKIISWTANEGDKIEPGTAIAEVETDKATMELEVFEDGTLLKILADADTAVPIGTPIAIMGEPGEDIQDLIEKAKSAQKESKQESKKEKQKEETPPAESKQPTAEKSSAKQAPPVSSEPQQPKEGGKIRISPVAQRMALELNVDITKVSGSGPSGRIVKRDIEEFAAQGAAAGAPAATESTPPAVIPPMMGGEAYVDVPLNRIRQITAERLPQSLGPIPHFYLDIDIDPVPMLEMKDKLQSLAEDVKITLSDILVKGCATALQRHPEINSQFLGKAVRRFSIANIGLAVAGKDSLSVPVIKFCDAKSIGQIARERIQLIEKAQNGKLTPDDLSGATFTISNLGMMGITKFCAVINPPQAAILAIGSIREVPVVQDGQVVPGKRMTVTMSCDHRAFDGADGAQFMATLKKILEKPLTLYL